MSGRVLVIAALLMMGTSAASTAKPAAAKAVFSCKLPGGKTVTVTGGGERFVYRYGTAKRAELTIVGTIAGKNLTKRFVAHGGEWFIDLRFIKGDYSYVAYSFPRSDAMDNEPRSGLRVYRGGKTILDRKCAPFANILFEDPDDLTAIPETPNGSPSAWGDVPDE